MSAISAIAKRSSQYQSLLAPILILGVSLVVLPGFLPADIQGIMTKFLIYAIFAISYDLIFGYTGLVSLGHAAFFGAGGYAGMRRAVEIIRAELERSMRLVGVRSVGEIREHGTAIRRQNQLIGNSWLPDFVY